jgi:hypothetical protein
MNNLNNPKNIIGMANLLADDDEDINLDDIEQSIANEQPVTRKEKFVDIAKEFNREISSINKLSAGPSILNLEDIEDKTQELTIDDLLNAPEKRDSQYKSDKVYKLDGPSLNLDDADDDDDDPGEWSMKSANDPQLRQMTAEESKQSHVNKVIGNLDKYNDDDADLINQEDEEDEMARIMEQIDLLRSNLESEGVDLSRIKEVTSTTEKKEAKGVLRILQIKNDRLRYCDFFEEGILAVAYGMESVFDGQREVFGSKIDLTGYSDTVKVKLRRMRYDTSTFVSNMMKGYNIGSGWRIVLELIPSLFLYSRDRKLTAKDSLMTDESYKKAMQNLTGS